MAASFSIIHVLSDAKVLHAPWICFALLKGKKNPSWDLKLSQVIYWSWLFTRHHKTHIWSQVTDEQQSCRCPDSVWANTRAGLGTSCPGSSQMFADSQGTAMKDQMSQSRHRPVLLSTSPAPSPAKPDSFPPLSLHTRRRQSIPYLGKGWEAFLHQEFKSRPPECFFSISTHLKVCPHKPKCPAPTLFPPQLLLFAPSIPPAHFPPHKLSPTCTSPLAFQSCP